jgi:hypothetical protein
MNGGMNEAMFSIIILPIVIAIKHATKALFLTDAESELSLPSLSL